MLKLCLCCRVINRSEWTPIRRSLVAIENALKLYDEWQAEAVEAAGEKNAATAVGFEPLAPTAATSAATDISAETEPVVASGIAAAGEAEHQREAVPGGRKRYRAYGRDMYIKEEPSGRLYEAVDRIEA